jgi:hypothetical protein
MKSVNNFWPFVFYFREVVLKSIVVFPTIRSRLRVVVLVKAYVVRRERNSFARIILAIDKHLPRVITEEFQVGFRM